MENSKTDTPVEIGLIVKDILNHRLAEIGYNDREDCVVGMCLQAVPELEKEYEWEGDN